MHAKWCICAHIERANIKCGYPASDSRKIIFEIRTLFSFFKERLNTWNTQSVTHSHQPCRPAIMINESTTSKDTCLWLPSSSHIPHLFGLNYAVRSSCYLNNLLVYCSVSLGSATLDSISDQRQANLGHSCRRFLSEQAKLLCACECVCLSVPVWVCVFVCLSLWMHVTAQRPQPSCVHTENKAADSQERKNKELSAVPRPCCCINQHLIESEVVNRSMVDSHNI